ncbi:MAG: bifunctional hydroxymethylpyrimidine kinase/phosphomethylpyrimidine kinase [Saprospiraceae bacterium]|nr:bifunctional hydroxymethylpyrimidine kinase/phosphomethylpyrimidine kinase [Saprospiraceae bacterium]
MSLLTVGTVAFDSIETPFGKADKVIGGAATYICWAASYFCSHQNLVSVIGDDWPVEEIDALNKQGVDTDGLQIIEGQKSFYWAGRYRKDLNQRDTLVTDLNVLADFDPVLPENYQDSDYLMLGNLTPEIQMAVIRQMEKRPKLIAMDTMNFWMDVALDQLIETIRMVDVLTINDEEARQLSGEYSLVKAAKKIFELGPKYLVIKKGEHGALLFHDDEVFFAPALPLLEVKDPTGAGDTFAGGFMGYLAKTDDISFENLKRALIYGSAMASFCVEEFSLNRLRRIKPEQLQKRLSQFKNLVHYNL